MERFNQTGIERMIVKTVTMLCKNSISYSSEVRIQGTLGITVDASRVILVQLNEFVEHSAEDSRRNASVRDGRGASDGTQADNYSLPGVKRPRMTSFVHSRRRPVGCVRGRVPVPAFQRAQSGHAASAPRARQQLAFPSPGKVEGTESRGLPRTSLQHVTPSCTSPRFYAGQVAASSVPVNEAAQQLPAKSEVEESSFKMTRHPISSNVICVESDDETENAVKVEPSARTSKPKCVSVKSEGESQDALQMIVNRAVLAARASNPGVVCKFLCFLYTCIFIMESYTKYKEINDTINISKIKRET